MTVSSAINRSGPYTGNGYTTAFEYKFRIISDTHLTVVVTSPAGEETTISLGVDYTVTGVGNVNGGNVITLSPVATDYKLTIMRNVPFTQETDLQNQGAYYAETVEDAFDLATMRDQQIMERMGRAWLSPVGGSGGVIRRGSNGQVASFDEDGNIAPRTPVTLPALAGATGLLLLASTTPSGARAVLESGIIGDPLFQADTVEAARAIIGALGSDDFGVAGNAIRAAIGMNEAKAAIGFGARRITYTAGGIYVLDPDDVSPGAVHYALLGATEVVKVDVSTLSSFEDYVFFNDSATAATPFSQGIIELDVGDAMIARGDGEAINNTASGRVIEVYPGDRVTLTKTGGNRVHVSRVSSGSWITGSNSRFRRLADGTIEVIYTRPENSNLGGGLESHANTLPVGMSLNAATVLSVTYGPKSDGSAPPPDAPQVTKLGTANGAGPAGVNAFSIRNPNASTAINHPVIIHFLNVLKV